MKLSLKPFMVLLAICACALLSAQSYRVSITAVNDNLASGTATTNSYASLRLQTTESMAAIHIDGTYAATLAVYESVDGLHRYAVSSSAIVKLSDFTTGISSNATGDYLVLVPPGSTVYVFCTAYTSGTPLVTVTGGQGSLPPGSTTASQNLTQLAGNSVATGAGVAGNGVLRVILASDGTQATAANQVTANTALAAIQTAVQGTLAVSGTFWQATQPISAASLPLPTGASTAANQTTGNTSLASILSALQGNLAITAASLPLPSGAATSALQTTANTTLSTISGQLPTALDGSGYLKVHEQGTATVSGTVTANDTPTTSGGCSASPFIAAGSTNATVLKASAGQLYGYYIFNAAASTRYVRFYNTSSSPTVGTTTTVTLLAIPAGGAANMWLSSAQAFATGISYATTTGSAANDTGAVTAGDIIATFWYK